MEGATTVIVATSEINLAEFPAIAAEIKERQDLVKAAPKDQKLLIYALGRQVAIGDNNEKKPGVLKIKEKKKWGAWDSLRGMEKQMAMRQFIIVGKQILGK